MTREFPYQTLFQRDGYNVEKWSDVEKLSVLESGEYDLILLDLRGVGKEHSQEEGLGILRHLRTVRPGQMVIAYSHADFPVDRQAFFQLADAVLAKSADYVDFKRHVDELLQKRYSSGFYIDRMYAELEVQPEQLPQLRRIAEKAIQRNDLDRLRDYVSGLARDKTTVDRILSLAQLGVSVAQLWKT